MCLWVLPNWPTVLVTLRPDIPNSLVASCKESFELQSQICLCLATSSIFLSVRLWQTGGFGLVCIVLDSLLSPFYPLTFNRVWLHCPGWSWIPGLMESSVLSLPESVGEEVCATPCLACILRLQDLIMILLPRSIAKSRSPKHIVQFNLFFVCRHSCM